MTVGEKIEVMQARVIDAIKREVAESPKQGSDTRRESINTEAETFVLQAIAAGKMTEGEASAVIRCYRQCQADDAIALGGVTDRVARLRGLVRLRPTAEDRRRELLAMTPAGRAALAKVA